MRSPLLPLLLATFVPLSAQDKPAPPRLTPLRVSPACTVAQDIGISRIEVAFARPAVKGRKIWGGLVPYGQVWRAGANSATTIAFSHPVKVDGRAIPAGTYGLFVIPQEKAWTLILNRKAKQWGAYDYKAEEDVLRWEVPVHAGPLQEFLDCRIVPVDGRRAIVELGWERLRVNFAAEFDTPAIYWAHLEDTLKKASDTDWVPWYQAAKYCQEQGLEPTKALAWIEKSLKAGESFWNHETAARILKDAGRTPEGVTHLRKAIELSKGKTPKEYTENLEKDLAAWMAAG